MPDAAQLISREHLSVDGTLLEASASQTRVRPLADDDPDRPVASDKTGIGSHSERRTNATQRSVTDPNARIVRKSNNTASILVC
jgi:hypothetical protein